MSILLLLVVATVLVVGIVIARIFLIRLVFKSNKSDQTAREYHPRSVSPRNRPQAAEPAAGGCPVCGAVLPADSPQGLCPQCLLKCALSNSDQAPEPDKQLETSAYQGPTTAPAAAELAPLFPQLEIIGLIGQGGMGAVYKARQIKLDRFVAVKILPADWGREPAFAERFAREARALARLNHSHIVAVHDFGETGGLFYLIMEFVDGLNLRQLMQRGPLAPEQALHFIPQVCAALQYAHGEGIVHRDIKPENILLDKRGQVKIADFGLAKLVHRTPAEFTLTGTRQVMGTLDYMAPEQRTAPQEVDHRADIYSLGVVLYEMLTGDLPIGYFAPPSEKAAVDERFDAVVFRALEREPDRRYQRISEVQAAVESLARTASAPVLPRGAEFVGQAELDNELIQMRVKAPATGLLIVGILISLEAIVFVQHTVSEIGPSLLVFVLCLVAFAITSTMICGAVQMARLESYGLVMATIILAMLPVSYHAVIGIPVGFWALAALNDPKVKAAFALNLRRSNLSRQGNPNATAPTATAKAARFCLWQVALGLGRDAHTHRPPPNHREFLADIGS